MPEIRCQFVFSGKNDELTPDFRAALSEEEVTLSRGFLSR